MRRAVRIYRRESLYEKRSIEIHPPLTAFPRSHRSQGDRVLCPLRECAKQKLHKFISKVKVDFQRVSHNWDGHKRLQ
jgi:hypothetical protein